MPARYRLNAGHYIHALQWDGSPTEWEYQEQSLVNNRMVRRRFKVPMYLNPNDPADFNYPGEIIVASGADERYPQDIIFEGEPTPDMTPLNKEAMAMVEKLSSKWVHPIDSLPGQFSQSLLGELEKQLSAVLTRAPLPQMNPVSSTQVGDEKMTEIMTRLAALEKRNVELEAKAAGVEKPTYDVEEPLPPPVADATTKDLPIPPPNARKPIRLDDTLRRP